MGYLSGRFGRGNLLERALLRAGLAQVRAEAVGHRHRAALRRPSFMYSQAHTLDIRRWRKSMVVRSLPTQQGLLPIAASILHVAAASARCTPSGRHFMGHLCNMQLSTLARPVVEPRCGNSCARPCRVLQTLTLSTLVTTAVC